MTSQSEERATAPRGEARATSYDVARLAGVSQSAVSRVFRAGGSVSAAMRSKVEEAARTLGYAPSQIARSLISQRSRMIAAIVTDLSNRAYPEILFYLGNEIQDTGNRMLVFALPSDDHPGDVLRNVLAYHVDGIVSSAVLDDEFLASCDRQNVPVVLFNRTPRGSRASAVACDHGLGMDLLISHIAARNEGPLAFLAGPEAAPVSRERLAGARSALAQLGRSIDRIVHSDYSFEGGRAAARQLMALPERPRTIVCANDSMALGVMDECRHVLGLEVPEDVAVTGFDDIPQASWPSYELTTLRQPVRRMAHMAVRFLTEQIGGQAAPGERRLLAAELMVRGSTR
ncbi:MAG TPA: LacI family DNA-binding transcriptional regulator [Geminicoccaceae bacterium]|nr:LacI family DNA-binding transcriptional regulator [Geminicoccus sp.]HMU49031.1 LacI family DNA-binding transcriptional regulator [Geminicoccaceae bacterium]